METINKIMEYINVLQSENILVYILIGFLSVLLVMLVINGFVFLGTYYADISPNLYLSVYLNKKRKAIFNMCRSIEKFNKDIRYVPEIYFKAKDEERYSKTDILIIGNEKLYIVKKIFQKNKISGSTNSDFWINQKGSKKEFFLNPLKEQKEIINILSDLYDNDYENLSHITPNDIILIVTFDEKADISKLKLEKEPIFVIRDNKIESLISKLNNLFKDEKFTEDDIIFFEDQLIPNIHSKKYRRKYEEQAERISKQIKKYKKTKK